MSMTDDSQDSCQWRMPYMIREGEHTEESLREELEGAGAEFLYLSRTDDDEGAVHEMHVMWRSKSAYNRYNAYKAMKGILRSEEGAYLTGVYQVPVQLPPSVTEALTQAIEWYGKGLDVRVVPVSQEVRDDGR